MSQTTQQELEAIQDLVNSVIEQLEGLPVHVFIHKEYTFSSKHKTCLGVIYRCSVVDNEIFQVKAQIACADLDALKIKVLAKLEKCHSLTTD